MDSVVPGGNATPTTDDPTPDAGGGWTPRLVVSFASMAFLLQMLACAYLMISIALPGISAHFHTTQGVWLVTAFLLVGSIASPILGKLADTHGKRLMLLWCVGLSAVGALLAALAPSFPLLLIGWSLTGMLSPCVFLVYSLIRDVYPARTVPMAVSVSTAGMGLIAVPAPFLTGWLLDNFGFRSIFWFFVVVLTLLVAVIRFTTSESPVRLRSRIDLIGALLLSLGLGGLLVGISFGPMWGWTAPATLGYLLGGIAFLVAWYASALKIREPLIDPVILEMRPVAMTSISSGMCYGALAAFSILLPTMTMTPSELGLGYGFGVSATGYALFQTPQGIATLLGGVVVGALATRMSPKKLMVAGMSLMTIALLMFAVTHDSKILVVLLAVLVGIGGGMGYAATPNLLIASVRPELQATTGAIASTAGNVVPAIVPIVVFAALNSHVAMSVDGATLYSSTGIALGFAITAVVAVIAALAIPNTIRQQGLPTHEDDSVAEDAVRVTAH